MPSTSFVTPTPAGVANAVISRVLTGGQQGVEPRDFTPGMSTKEQINQLSAEDPIYGSMVKSMYDGNAARGIYAGRDPYTTYAALAFADWIASLFRPARKTGETYKGPKEQHQAGRSTQEFFGPSKHLPKDKPAVSTGRM